MTPDRTWGSDWPPEDYYRIMRQQQRAGAGGGSEEDWGFNPISLNPEAWWPFDDGEGIVAADASGNGYDLDLSNTPAWLPGGGITFNGVDQKGETTAAGLLAALQGSSEFTIFFMARAATFQTNAAAFAVRNGTSIGELLLVYPFDSQGGNGARTFWNNVSSINQDAGAPSLNEWHSFAFVVRAADDQELFVDNISVGTSATPNSISATLSHVTVGAWNGGQFCAVDMRNSFVFSRALLPEELLALHEWAS